MLRLSAVTAILLGVALLATPVFAQTAGNKNLAATPSYHEAPLILPGEATPTPPLKIDALTLSRGPLALDPAAALAGMGTVSLKRDGSTVSTPASESLRAALEQETKGSATSGTNRMVPLVDDRVQITDASDYPAHIVGWLWSQAQDDSWSTCSATLIGPFTVVTAAHCVYFHEKDGWIKQVVFLPGVTDPESAPFGQFEWESINVLKGFIDNYDGINYGSVMPWDLAVITLTEDAGNQLGWMGFRVDVGTQWAAVMLGYPADKPDGTMWMSTCDIAPEQLGEQIYWHDCDSFAGSSGAAMFEDVGGGNLYVRGVNVAEDEERNYGLRFIESYFQFLIDNYK